MIDVWLKMNPKYPIYIISKGRWKSRHTSKALEGMNVPYKIVVEPQEYKKYAEVISPEKILTLPFSNLGEGSIPARNWVWEHSVSMGSERHWIMDDNILCFLRRNHNIRIRVATGSIFKASEDFVDRYENVALAGFHYDYFAPDIVVRPAFRLNSRIYSCILIKNDIDFRWRGKYNEDTDLSLRVLKEGMCTVLFYAFLSGKLTTMSVKGGNTEELYNTGDNRLEFAESLQKQHPDVVKITKKKFGRFHHQVDYRKFLTNKLILKTNLKVPMGINNYGMSLKSYDPKTKIFSDGGFDHEVEIEKNEPFNDDIFG